MGLPGLKRDSRRPEPPRNEPLLSIRRYRRHTAPGHLLVCCMTELSPRTFCTFAREFSPFTARGCSWATSDSGDGFGRVVERPHDPFPPSPRKRTGPRALRSCVPSAVGGHAAVSRDGHVRQAADRLAPARARRAVSAPDARSAGTASPVPKNISSGGSPLHAG